MDAKDILGIPKNGKKSKPPKEHHRKPDGISREVYMLTGGVAPLMPAIDTSQLKKRPPSHEKVTWKWLSFKNSARKHDLELYHWVRVVNGVPPTGDYPFAKSVDVIRYTAEEYDKYLTNPRRVGDQDRPFIPDALNFGGDRVGKKDQRRKGPGRPPDAPSSPATKRARKFKIDG